MTFGRFSRFGDWSPFVLKVARELDKSQIRMVAGFAEVINREETSVAAGGFEPPTFGLRAQDY